MLGIIYSHTAWMGEVLLAAERSQLIDPAFDKKAAAVKDDLEVAAAAPTMHKVIDYVHAARLKRAMVQLVNARRMFKKLQCPVYIIALLVHHCRSCGHLQIVFHRRDLLDKRRIDQL